MVSGRAVKAVDVGKAWANPVTESASLQDSHIFSLLASYLDEPPVGFEPTTPALQERCSGQLS